MDQLQLLEHPTVRKMDYKKRFEIANHELEKQSVLIDDLKKELDIMYAKIIAVEKDRDQMKKIMTDNIIQSNEKINAYAEEINLLKK